MKDHGKHGSLHHGKAWQEYTRCTAHCKEGDKCYNIQCSYRKQYQIANCTQFEKEEGETVGYVQTHSQKGSEFFDSGLQDFH